MKSLAAGLVIFSCGGMGFGHRQQLCPTGASSARADQGFAGAGIGNPVFPHHAAQAPCGAGAPVLPVVVGRFLPVLNEGLEAGTGDSLAAIWEQGLAVLAENGLPQAVLEELHSWVPFWAAVMPRSRANISSSCSTGSNRH